MKKRLSFQRFCTVLLVAFWFCLAVLAWCAPSKQNSDSERRPLSQFPSINASSVLSTKFMTDFESYTLDQFPFRDNFRKLKALFFQNFLRRQDNNGIYIANGYAVKTEYPLNESSLDYALKKFDAIYEKYLEDSKGKIYSCVVPDKGYYLAKESGHLSMDYEKLFERVSEGMPYSVAIDITDTLGAESYYYTDTHWRQEKLFETAKKLANAMNVKPPDENDFSKVELEKPFYGVYFGQAALPMKSEKLYIMESELLSGCVVTNHESEKTSAVYDMEKLSSKDLYEVFLSGSVSLLTLTDENAKSDRELIVFRDSFASSIVPLLMQGYKSITLIDIRYLSSANLDKFVNFHGQDVLFMYSTLVLNNSSTIK